MVETLCKPLLDMTAADVMSQSVVLVPQEMSLPAAGRLLSQAQVSGAPVVDATGRCIGVLSATDFMNWAQHERGGGLRSLEDSVCFPWQLLEAERLPQEAVSRHMTPDPVTAVPSTRLGILAQMMLDAHIHRVIVVDKARRPIGIVSTTDVLAAVACAERARK